MVDAAFGEVIVTCEKIWWLCQVGRAGGEGTAHGGAGRGRCFQATLWRGEKLLLGRAPPCPAVFLLSQAAARFRTAVQEGEKYLRPETRSAGTMVREG